jgi:DNA-binding MarR family transcriptional regulator
MNHRDTMARLNAALSKIDLAYETIAKKHGLTFNSLMMIYLMDKSENITQKQICDELHLPKSTVHSILLDFIKQGYATLVEGSNKKEKFIAVTATGRSYFRGVLEKTESIEKNVLDALGEEACTFLTDKAEIVGKLLSDEIAKINEGEVK